MAIWEDFETNCTDYLNRKFGAYAQFIHHGGADSTVPDILVITNLGKRFYIDAKHSPAQCGQFVLLPNISEGRFEYSRQNVNQINTYAAKIMAHMDERFDEFREAGTAGKDIVMGNGSHIFSEWIIQAYKEKGAKLFITNNYTILPVERFADYFEVSAKYRIKRSGSSSVGNNRIAPVLRHIKASDYIITNSRVEGDKLFVESNRDLHNRRFVYMQYEYMFSQRGSEYEIRKLSNTYNANVIFSIKHIESTRGLSDGDFTNFLK